MQATETAVPNLSGAKSCGAVIVLTRLFRQACTNLLIAKNMLNSEKASKVAKSKMTIKPLPKISGVLLNTWRSSHPLAADSGSPAIAAALIDAKSSKTKPDNFVDGPLLNPGFSSCALPAPNFGKAICIAIICPPGAGPSLCVSSRQLKYTELHQRCSSELNIELIPLCQVPPFHALAGASKPFQGRTSMLNHSLAVSSLGSGCLPAPHISTLTPG